MIAQQLIRDLAFLTGPAAAGRLSGTPGAQTAARYLAEALAQAGYSPALQNSFFQPVSVPAARLAGAAHLQVGQRSFLHRKDFGEVAALSAGGSFTAPLKVIRDGEPVDPAEVEGRILLLAEKPEGLHLAGTATAAADLGALALLVADGEPDWFHKTVYAGAGRIPVLRVRQSAAAELAPLDGAIARLSLPLTAASLPCRNVLGLRLGSRSDLTVVLTAHYDHLGDDPGGHRFPGAADNASGVAAILTAARLLQAEQLPFTLLVAFLTGEESGLHGARKLIQEPPRPLSAAINLDITGIEDALYAIRLGHQAPGHWLADQAAGYLAEQGIAPRWITGGDDSVAFVEAGIPVLGLGQITTRAGSMKIHVPDDRPDRLHPAVIQRTAELIASFVGRLTLNTSLLERSASHV